MTTTKWLNADEERVWRSLVVVWRLGFLELERTFKRHGLIHLEYGVLAVLSESESGTLNAGRLADLIGLSTSHLSHRLKNLEGKAMITRRQNPDDGRIVDITITDLGREVVAEVAPEHVADVRRLLFDHMSAADTAATADVFARVAGALTDDAFLPRR